MRFLFVDKITDQASATGESWINGSRFFGVDDPMRRGSEGYIVPGAISEAIGQLASWLCMARNEFAARPVFLFAEAIELLARVPTGSTVELTATISDQNEQALRFSGEARVQGAVVQRLSAVGAALLPLVDVEDPNVTKARYAALCSPEGLRLDGAFGPPLLFEHLAGATTALEPGRLIRAQQRFSPTEPFYADHFPRFPVTPIVVLNEMIGAVAARLFGPSARVELKRIEGLKIRNFVRPGEVCETLVRIQRWSYGTGTHQVEAVAEVTKDGKCILRGRYHLQIEGLIYVPTAE